MQWIGNVLEKALVSLTKLIYFRSVYTVDFNTCCLLQHPLSLAITSAVLQITAPNDSPNIGKQIPHCYPWIETMFLTCSAAQQIVRVIDSLF